LLLQTRSFVVSSPQYVDELCFFATRGAEVMTRIVELMRTTLIVGLTTVSGSTIGAGFYVQEVGSPGSLGTAGVANPANTWGADASWTNPAGMTRVEQEHVMGGFQFLLPSIKFNTQSAVNTS
jgi:long-subunit fatty acid transport protein